jgi:hypothetical protein
MPTSTPTHEDTSGPTITNVNPTAGQVCADGCCGAENSSLDISAIATDPSGVRSVELYCTLPGEEEQHCGTFVRIGGDNWMITYDPPEIFNVTITYRIKAADDSPRENVSSWGTGYIEVYYIIC